MEITITVDNHIGDPDFATCTVDDLKTTITVEIKGNVEFPSEMLERILEETARVVKLSDISVRHINRNGGGSDD